MKRTVVYWKTSDMERMKAVKAELGISVVSVNGESEYKGDVERLKPYIEEGLIVVRMKEYEERRIKEVRVDSEQGKSDNCQTIGCGGRKRKV